MFDVFISYGHQDQPWVRTLAENLYRAGLEVFYDEWEIGPGDVLVHRLDEGIRTSRNGILVISPTSLARPWVAEEYAAMVTRTVAGQQRLIPVLLGEAELPPFLAARVWVDFRHADGPEYDRRVSQLVAALRGERLPRPGRYETLVPPPGSGFRPEGTRHATLHLSSEEVSFTSDENTVSHHPHRLDAGIIQRIWELGQAQQHPDALLRTVLTAATGSGDAVLHQRSLAAGAALTETFLSGLAGEALATAVNTVTHLGGSLTLALEIQEELAALPWETLRLPVPKGGEVGPPLVLDPHVKLYRSVSGLGPTPAMVIAGPLRILVTIASPEADNVRGQLLDYEAELGRILDAVDPSRHGERPDRRAYVRILNQGTVQAVSDALQQQRFHVLHLSCHARPGVLVLEDEDGREDPVDAARFAAEVLVPDRGLPLVVLAGCATGLPEQMSDAEEVALRGLARGLATHGVPTVLATTASVSDRYATKLAEEFYRTLSTAENPDPLTVFSQARRSLEHERLRTSDQGLRMLAEWATPTLFLRGPSLPLYDRQEAFETLTLPLEPQFNPQMVVREVGDFVGRRTELRQGRRVLRTKAGLVLHGLGGVGKSTMAAQLVRSLLREGAGLVVSISGPTSTDAILSEVGEQINSLCRRRSLPEDDPWRELGTWLRNPKSAWSDRLKALVEEFTATEPLYLMLDNFEDNLTTEAKSPQVADPELAAFLKSWVQRSGRARLLITSRYPFELPEQAHHHLVFQHLGPLSWAETRKLFWRLPGLDALARDDQQQAYLDVGGHPRTLEYLDALLRGGRARFPDVAMRMERALAARGLTPATTWKQGKPGLDAALAEAVTLAVDDVVLSQLLDRLEAVPLSRLFLLGAAVYRLPIDDIGLGWQVGDEQLFPADPDRDARLARLDEALQAALAKGRPTELDTLGLSSAELTQIRQDLAELTKSPLRLPLGFEQAKAVLLDLGLLAPVSGPENPSYLVHRWTAQALAKQGPAEQLAKAHHRAALYWLWRARSSRQSPEDNLEQMLEARYHHHAAGELDEALTLTQWACNQLHTWGAYSREERLCREALTWIPNRSGDAAVCTIQLGLLAETLGNYEEAHRQYQHALEIVEELGDQKSMASIYNNLGNLAYLQGDYDEARRQCQRALEIQEELGDRASIAGSYHQLGLLAQAQSDYQQAWRQNQRALEIFWELGDQKSMAGSHNNLGNLAYLKGDYDEARRQCQRALEIAKELGDRASVAGDYHQLGLLAEAQSDYQQAWRHYQRSLEISEELGEPARMAASYGQLGALAQKQGDYDEAQHQQQRALEIFEQLGNRVGMAGSYHSLGILAQEQGDYDEAQRHYQRALEIVAKLGNRANMAGSYHQLGILAQLQGDYEEARRQCQLALEIREELGESAGMAASYGQLGNLAHVQGNYEEARRQYQRALEIFEQLGDRANIAVTYRQLGALLTQTGEVEEAVGHTLASLDFHFQVRAPEACLLDLHWLAYQQQQLGETQFRTVVHRHLGEQDTDNLLQLLKGTGG